MTCIARGFATSVAPFLRFCLSVFSSFCLIFFSLFAFMHFPFGSCQYLALKVNPVHFFSSYPRLLHHAMERQVISPPWFSVEHPSRKENCTARFARTYRMSNMAPIGHDKQTHHSASASRRRWPLRGRATASEMRRGGRRAAVGRVSQLSHGVTRASPTATQLIIHSGWGGGWFQNVTMC